MSNQKLIDAQNALYSGNVKDIDRNLKSLLRVQKEIALAHKLDDELER